MSNFYRHPGRAGGFPVLVKAPPVQPIRWVISVVRRVTRRAIGKLEVNITL